ncbi:hypothetical protein V7114_19490 [Neobacillus niacini]|uniref:hypothetical protein n=1 Tax=Neobacillus niacini TaxID=86668 RepID=UPI002FFD9ED9
MNITIEIHYATSSRAYQKGSFQHRGKRPEMVALEFWKQIQKDLSYNAVLEKVISAGQDITQLVEDLEKVERRKNEEMADYLPI